MYHRLRSHKRTLFTIALILTFLMTLAPSVGAAPDTVSAVNITQPTNAAKAIVKAGSTFDVEYDVTVTTVAQPAHARFYLGATLLETVPVTLVLGPNSLAQTLTVPAGTAEALYDVKVEVKEDSQANWIADTELQAVVVDNTGPTIKADTLIAPNGGEYWRYQDPSVKKDITWKPGDITDPNLAANPISLLLSCDGGATYPHEIAANEANDGKFEWAVGICVTTQARVRLVAVDVAGNTSSDASNANFTIFSTDDSPPTVDLTAPANGTFVKGTIDVTADAEDTDSGIDQVVFQVSSDEGATWAPIGAADMVPPYAVTLNTATFADGAVLWIRAIATNGVGGMTTTDPVEVTVDNSAPSVAVTAPAAGAFVKGVVPVVAAASDAHSGIDQVTFEYAKAAGGILNWVLIGTDDSSPFSANWDTTTAATPDGAYGVRAIAKNGADTTTTSAVVNVTVDNTSPTKPVLTAPTAGTVWTLNVTHAITWQAASITDTNLAANPVSLYFWPWGNPGAKKAIAENIANTGSYNWLATGMLSGDYEVQIVAADKAGNTNDATSGKFALWVVDETLPNVALTAPAAGLVKDTISVAATASDPESGIVEVAFWFSTDDGATWDQIDGSDAVPPYSVNFDTNTVDDGEVWFKATAQNGVGNVATSAIVEVTVDNTAPVVNLVQPAGGLIISGLAYPLSGTATDGGSGLMEVKFWYDADPQVDPPPVLIAVGVASGNPNEFRATWNTNAVADGSWWVIMSATDLAGNTEYDMVQVTIQNTVSIALKAGWNLVSMPIVPYDPNIQSVIAGLIANGSVKQVATFVWEAGALVQKVWSAGPKTLTTMVDGRGYWIEMTKDDTLVVHGTFVILPPSAPPSYQVYSGWNLIGFTSLDPAAPARSVASYLGPAVYPSMSAIYYYDVAAGYYKVPAAMMAKLGYWLAVNANGTIYP